MDCKVRVKYDGRKVFFFNCYWKSILNVIYIYIIFFLNNLIFDIYCFINLIEVINRLSPLKLEFNFLIHKL